jgi:hypothetical protein
MDKLQTFVITNICKPRFVFFGRIGARCALTSVFKNYVQLLTKLE